MSRRIFFGLAHLTIFLCELLILKSWYHNPKPRSIQTAQKRRIEVWFFDEKDGFIGFTASKKPRNLRNTNRMSDPAKVKDAIKKDIAPGTAKCLQEYKEITTIYAQIVGKLMPA